MILTLFEHKQAQGIVIAIDVLRAFTTSSVLFDRGVKEIFLVKDLNIALNTKRNFPSKSIIFGEKGGRHIKGFDYENSPAQMNDIPINPERVWVQRTSSGTRGALSLSKNPNVKEIIAGSFTTALYLKDYLSKKKDNIDYLITGSRTPDGGTEDIALAEFLMGKINYKEAVEKIYSCYSVKNWIKNMKDVYVATNNDYNFIQKIYKTNSPNILLLKRED